MTPSGMTVKTTSAFSIWLLASGVMCDPRVIPTPTQTRLPVLLTPFPVCHPQGRIPLQPPPGVGRLRATEARRQLAVRPPPLGCRDSEQKG